MEKAPWSGRVVSVQPRTRLTRSLDQRSHSYLGFCLVVEGIIRDEPREFSIGIGKVAQLKHQLRFGDEISGESLPVADPRKEPVEFYRTSKLKVMQRSDEESRIPPPWLGVPPDLETYRWRGYRLIRVIAVGWGMAGGAVDVILLPGICGGIIACCVTVHTFLDTRLSALTQAGVVVFLVSKMTLHRG